MNVHWTLQQSLEGAISQISMILHIQSSQILPWTKHLMGLKKLLTRTLFQECSILIRYTLQLKQLLTLSVAKRLKFLFSFQSMTCSDKSLTLKTQRLPNWHPQQMYYKFRYQIKTSVLMVFLPLQELISLVGQDLKEYFILRQISWTRTSTRKYKEALLQSFLSLSI